MLFSVHQGVLVNFLGICLFHFLFFSRMKLFYIRIYFFHVYSLFYFSATKQIFLIEFQLLILHDWCWSVHEISFHILAICFMKMPGLFTKCASSFFVVIKIGLAFIYFNICRVSKVIFISTFLPVAKIVKSLGLLTEVFLFWRDYVVN